MHAKRGHVTNTHIIGGLVLGYLAMVGRRHCSPMTTDRHEQGGHEQGGRDFF